MSVLIGIISDTHGVINKNALEALKGSDIIIHAGDIGKIDVINILETIAPVYAVKGNVDKGQWANKFLETEIVEVDETRIYIIHDIDKMDLELKRRDFDIVIYGHSHKYSKKIENGIVYINPGSAGHKRFNLPLTIALLHLYDNGKKEVKIIHL